ncbi:hypothetical protein C7271_12230 [filamentous cyanobacterium CCP5]|nr:hypothetical protein C7271_12230 [filamentous cyanobacterium CCP5]
MLAGLLTASRLACKPQQQFMLTLITTMVVVCSKVNRTNQAVTATVARAPVVLVELPKTRSLPDVQSAKLLYRRHFEQSLGLESWNQTLIE